MDQNFTLFDLRKAIPEHCFRPSFWRSLSYFALDIGIIVSLAAMALYLNSWFFWPIYWFFQGTMFASIFVIGHEGGHGNIAKTPWVNHFFGYLCHSFLLIPYHSWRITHRNHHLNAGHIDHEEAWHPLTKTEFQNLSTFVKIARFHLFLFDMIPYLIFRSTRAEKQGSHYHPDSPIFEQEDRPLIVRSVICCALALGILISSGFLFGWGLVAKLYLVPYILFMVYFSMITFLHHSHPEIPWYRNQAWNYLMGALSTIDYDYRFIGHLQHNIGIHVVHHLFMNVPHYHLKEATNAIIPILGKQYRKSKISPFKALWNCYKKCRYVPDEGDIVYYRDEKD